MARHPNTRAENGTPHIDVHQRITDTIIATLEKGTPPWIKSWNSSQASTRPLRACGIPYSGINVILLWAEATNCGYANQTWMTFRQAIELGAHVRKGEHGTTIVYANRISRTETADDGSEAERHIAFLKSYTVFNVEQIDSLPERFYLPAPTLPLGDRTAAAFAFFDACSISIRHGGTSAHYSPSTDHVQMPDLADFTDEQAYIAVLAHEATHWTGAPSRLDRNFGARRFGDEGYCREELVAEMGSAFLCADLGIDLEPRPDHASYIADWLIEFNNDKRLVVAAAAHAQRAVDYMTSLQPPP